MERDTAIAIFNRRANDIQAELDRVNGQRQSEVMTANPGMDTGGIRGQSEKRRDASMDRTISLANRGIDLQQERDTCRNMAENLHMWGASLDAINKRILAGVTVKGEPLTSAHLKTLREDAKYRAKRVSGLLCAAMDICMEYGYQE